MKLESLLESAAKGPWKQLESSLDCHPRQPQQMRSDSGYANSCLGVVLSVDECELFEVQVTELPAALTSLGFIPLAWFACGGMSLGSG